MTTLIIADHDNRTLSPAAAHLVTAARALAAPVHVLVAGHGCADVAAAAATLDGVDAVLVADDPAYAHHLAEPLAALLAELARDYRTILASTGTMGKDVLPRAAARLGCAQISDVVAIAAPDTFVRSAFAGNALETLQSEQPLNILTVRASSFEPVGASGAAPISPVTVVPVQSRATFVDLATSAQDRPDLQSARVVVSGGRALGSKERFDEIITPLAARLNAAIGASRAAVDAGYVPNEYQVGQTGKVVAPDLYIACGISGAVQHLAGMKDSKVIVAINSDAESPIFAIADYGLVADIFEAVPELTGKL